MNLKKYIRVLCIIMLMVCALIACKTSSKNKNFLFDIGGNGSSLMSGYTAADLNSGYAKQQGFGWIMKPDSTFDVVEGKWNNALNRDGVIGKDSIVFKADVPDGDYILKLTVGRNTNDPMRMLIAFNGKRLSDTIRTPWFRLNFKTFASRVKVTSGSALISVTSPTGKVALQSIELRPVPVTRYTMPWGIAQDTALVRTKWKELHRQLKNDSTNLALINQIDDIDNYLTACHYYNLAAWSDSVKKSGINYNVRMYLAVNLLQQIKANTESPLHDRAVYLLGRIHYWLQLESYDVYNDNAYQECFDELKTKYADNDTLQMYLGKKIPFGIGEQPQVEGAPQWAVYQHEAMQRMLKVIHWWVNKRQHANGELGGKYGDDVEILRWWLPAIMGADDTIAKKGYLRLVDGVWNSGILENGYAKHIDDVEHSAELFRDTHPAMFMIDYGNPEYVERCLISMQNFRDTWTGITPMGHRHFKSFYLSAKSVSQKPGQDLDLPLNARATMPGLWALWYNRNPSLMKLFTQWSDAWIADARRTDGGKPAGILPATILFKNDQVGAYTGKWYDPEQEYSYYRWQSLGHINELQSQLIGLYDISHNSKYLEPLNRCYQLMLEAQKEGLQANPQPGSLPWVKKILLQGGEDNGGDNPMADVFAMARQVTGGTNYDALVKQMGQPYNKFQISGDVQAVTRNFTKTLNSLRYNFPMLTSEVKYTDRVYVPGSDLLLGMYTGQFGSGFEYPLQVVTWKNTGKDVAVFVRKGDRRSALISLFNFSEERQVTMNTWMAQPGIYKLKAGFDTNDDGVIDEVKYERQLTLKERVNAVTLNVLAKKQYVIQLEQQQAFKPLTANLPDIALSARDIQADQQAVHVAVHNIGNIQAKNVRVELWVDDKPAGSSSIATLDAPNELNPRIKTVTIKWPLSAGKHRLKVRVSGKQAEITSFNNELVKDVLVK